MPPAKLGVVYPVEGYRLFLDLVGLANAKELFLTGRQVDAWRALQMGLVHRVLPEAELEPYTLRLAEEMAEENAPLAVRASKWILDRLSGGPLSEEDEREARRLLAEALASGDLREARAAFAEKRRPRFTGT
jgi:enoyl-CoA hydratase/carnithine racemase